MATFLDIVTDLMDTINRPVTETQVYARAKRSVNSAVTLVQRHHAFRFTDALLRFTYPANTLKISLSTVCDGLLRDIVSTQILGTETSTSGGVLPYSTYTQIQRARDRYARLNEHHSTEWEAITNELGHANYTTLTHKHIVFRFGQDVGLYPAPTTDVHLLMHAHKWLPLLVNDADTNFFLDYAYDVILGLSLKFMAVYMKEDNRVPVSLGEFKDSFDTLVAFDAQVHESNFTPLT